MFHMKHTVELFLYVVMSADDGFNYKLYCFIRIRFGRKWIYTNCIDIRIIIEIC